MGNSFSFDANEKNIFGTIYKSFIGAGYDQTEGHYLVDMIPFMFIEDNKCWNTHYKTARGYLIDALKEDNIETVQFARVRKKIESHALSLLKDNALLKKAYKGNKLVDTLRRNHYLYAEICDNYYGWSHQKATIMASTNLQKYETSASSFLLHLVCYIFSIFPSGTTPKEQDTSRLTKLLADNNCTFDEAYDYLEFSLLKDGTSTNTGAMEILKKAGYPDNINKKCDPFTLLKASDYYYNKIKASENFELSEKYKAYAYKYSEVAYKARSPQAAWNLGYFCYAHKRVSPNLLSDSEYDNDPESILYLKTALKFFNEAAKNGYTNAINSIGNIAKRLDSSHKNDSPEYAHILNELISISKRMHISGSKEYSSPKELTELFYRIAAERGVFAGYSNYYKFLINKIIKDIDSSESQLYIEDIKDKHKDDIAAIVKYIDILCDYRHPSALTDKAALMLHRHEINDLIEEKRVMNSAHNHLKAKDKYDFIFEYHPSDSEKRTEPLKLLKLAIDDATPAPPLVWPYYYLCLIAYDNLRYTEASDYINQAMAIISKDKSSDYNDEKIQPIKDLADKCESTRKRLAAHEADYITGIDTDTEIVSKPLIDNMVQEDSPLNITPIDNIFIAEHGLPNYWMQRLRIQNSVILTEPEKFNKKFRDECKNVWGREYYDFSNVLKSFNQTWIREYSFSFDKTTCEYYYNNIKLPDHKISEYEENIGTFKDSSPLFAVANQNTIIYKLPTEDIISNSPKAKNILIKAHAKLNDPIIVLHKSADKKFVFVIHRYAIGWIKEKDCSCFMSKIEWEKYQSRKFIVVTRDNGIKEIKQELLMGTKLYLDKQEASNNKLCIMLPSRKKRNFDPKYVQISTNNYINDGYLSFTTTNLTKQVFQELGAPYGHRDNSRFIHDIYLCFGLELPIKTETLQKTPNITYSGKNMMDIIRFGDILIMENHLAIYLGKLDGVHFVVNMLNSYTPSTSDEDSKKTIEKPNRVMISTMNLKLSDGLCWIDNLQYAINFSRME